MGFAAAARLSPDAPSAPFGALVVGYLIAAAAGNAVPLPGGVGSADAALVGVLVVAHQPAAAALATVLAFRLITFWVPALVGLFAAPVLRRRGAL